MPSRLLDSLLRPFRKSSSAKRGKSPRRQHAGRGLHFEPLEKRELLSITPLTDFSVSSNTGEKPQSKVWEYNDQWYSVMPDKTGTWLWHLNGTQWEHQLQLSTQTGTRADVKVDGDLAHVLLYAGTNSQLATVQFDAGPDNRYEMWALRPALVNVALSSGVETATIDIDSTGRMWLASDVKSTVEVRYSDASSLYSSWSAPITVATGIGSDDISSIIAMPNDTIGVFWSNQNSKRFGFRTHVDGAAADAWSADEVPASQSALKKGKGMADDHLHLAVAADGTLYVAAKTSYDSGGYSKIVLLVRRPWGAWDNVYHVDGSGTRAVVAVNDTVGKLIVAYTSKEGGGTIYYKESPLDVIALGARQTLIGGKVNDVSPAKQCFTDEMVFIAAGKGKAKGVMFRFDTPLAATAAAPLVLPANLAPLVNAGADQMIQLPALANVSAVVSDDSQPAPSKLTLLWTLINGPGTATFGNAASAATTVQFSQPGTYVLRLSVNDGLLTAFDELTISVLGPLV
jgi:hypothetical protein